VTGTSVLGLKFSTGVLLAADNLGKLNPPPSPSMRPLSHCYPLTTRPLVSAASYGSLARFKDIVRLHPVGSHTILGASGDMADFQQVKRMLDNLM